MALYVITHKYLEQLPVQSDDFRYLYVGAYRQNERENSYLFDDDGVNISEKNSNYCELTGMFWIWKNSREEYKGLVHYRRFFTHNFLSAREKYYYSEQELQKLLEEVDCIVPERLYVAAPSIYEHYSQYHYQKDLDLLRQIVNEQFSEYAAAFEEAFSRNYFFPCNMLYCRREVFDAYCEWLFHVLRALEQKVDILGYNAAQARIFGFISERLLNVWLLHNKISLKEVYMIQTDSSLKYRVRLRLDRIFKRAIREKKKYDR